MGVEFRCICKDCQVEFGYSEASIQVGTTRGLSRPERCPACRRIHSREGQSIGIPQIPLKPIGRRKPDSELLPGRLGKIFHPDRPHRKTVVEGKFGKPDSLIDFGITDDDIRTLFNTMRDHQVVVVVGPTGSGKSTFLPYRLMVPPEGFEPDLFSRYGQIVITQPRVQATRSIAAFVARDLHGSTLGAGFDVGFRHRDAPMSDWRNKLVYVTDGTLINWIVSGQLDKLSVIMIDEAHERSLNIDLILGLLKQQLPRYPLLKLIIASATINADLFQNYYGGPEKTPLITFRGLKQYSVEAYFPPGDAHLKISHEVSDEMAKKVRELLLMISKGVKEEGDILGFLPGANEIQKCIKLLKAAIQETEELRDLGIGAYPLYSSLPQVELDRALAKKTHVIRDRVIRYIEEFSSVAGKDRLLVLLLDQKSASEAKGLVDEVLVARGLTVWITRLVKPNDTNVDSLPKQVVFATHDQAKAIFELVGYKIITDRRVIISTNVAETSLTVDGIVYVVDCGLIKESRWDSVNGASELPTFFHSRAGCRQRWGRAGRVRDGEAHMLYTDVQFEDPLVFPAHTLPQIQRSCLESVVLAAKAAGINDIKNFDWIQPPPETELERAPSTLAVGGALDADGDLTGFGMELQSFMTEIPVASLIIVADQFACGVEMATLAALRQVQFHNLLSRDWRWDIATRSVVKRIHKGLSNSCIDDLELYFKVYCILAETTRADLRKKFCQLFFIDEKIFETKVQETRSQFLEMLAIGKKAEEDRTLSFASLERFRFILAVTLPKRFLFCGQSGKIKCLDESVRMEVDIDETAIQPDPLPSFFLAMDRRIKGKGDKKRLSLSCLIRIEEDWLQMREKNTGELFFYVAKHFRDEKSGSAAGTTRARILADVFFPVGSIWSVTRREDGSVWPESMVSLPEPVTPVFNEEKIDKEEDTSQDDIGDIDPLAGVDDKEDRMIAEGEEDGNRAPILVYDDDDSSNGLVVLPEARFLKTCFDFRIDSDLAYEMCEVIGFQKDDKSGRTVVLLQPRLENGHEIGGSVLGEGQQYEVKGEAVLTEGKETALVVSLSQHPEKQFVIGAGDLSFSGRYLIPQKLVGKTFNVMAVSRYGIVSLSRLPLVEKKLQEYAAQNKRKMIPCTLVEMDGINGRVLLNELEKEGITEIAYVSLRQPPNARVRIHYEINKIYDLYLKNDYGEAHESLHLPSKKLLEWIEENKKKHGIFYNTRQRRLHTTKALTTAVRTELAVLIPENNFTTTLARLYRRSNQVKMYTKPGKKPKDIDSIVGMEEHRFAEVPEYKKGEIVRGRISEIWDDSVYVVLNRGGRGKLEKNHVAWDAYTLIDLRERVSTGQEIEARVLEIRDVKSSRVGDKTSQITIKLSLLEKEDFSSELEKDFKRCSHKGRILFVSDEKGFARLELEMGVVGVLFANQISCEKVEKISDHLQQGDEVDVKVLGIDPSPDDIRNPLKLKLSMKALIAPPPKKEVDLKKYQNGSVHLVLITHVLDEKGFSFAELEPGITGLIHKNEVSHAYINAISEYLKNGDTCQARIIDYDQQTKRFNLSVKNAFIKELQVDACNIKRIVGPGGQTVKEIRTKSGCWINCNFKSGMVTISGSNEEAILSAKGFILKCLAQPSSPTGEIMGRAEQSAPYPKKQKSVSTTVLVPINKIGTLIGKQGSKVKELREKSQCRIWCNDGVTLIEGKNREDVKKAVDLITGLILKATWDGSMNEVYR
jgi:HrpA-like RNA helicase/predicted RNA-binding protein with RPS1 domain